MRQKGKGLMAAEAVTQCLAREQGSHRALCGPQAQGGDTGVRSQSDSVH